MGQKLWLGVLIHSRGGRCSPIIDHHLDDKGIIGFLLVVAQGAKEFRKIIHTVQSKEAQDFFELGSSKLPFKVLGCIMTVLMCFSVCMLGQLSGFAGCRHGAYRGQLGVGASPLQMPCLREGEHPPAKAAGCI